RRGYFSRALIEGLEGNATDPRTGYVTDAILHSYVSGWVRERTANRPAHQRQAIEMKIDPSHSITFGPPRQVRVDGPPRAPGRQYHQALIYFPAGFDGDVDLVAPDGSTMQWRASKGPWTVMVFDGLWMVQPTDPDPNIIRF